MSCGICGKKEDFPHICAYCGGPFCDEHSLPENHNCYKMSIRNWDARQAYAIAKGNISTKTRKSRKIRAPAPEGWTYIEDYDPNLKIEEEKGEEKKE